MLQIDCLGAESFYVAGLFSRKNTVFNIPTLLELSVVDVYGVGGIPKPRVFTKLINLMGFPPENLIVVTHNSCSLPKL